MNVARLGAAFAAALLLGSCATIRPEGLAIEILDCGVVDQVARTGRVDAPGTSLGYVYEVDERAIPKFRPGCPFLEIAPGNRMGIIVRVKGDVADPSVPVTVRVTHPPIVNPKEGSPRERDEWSWDLDTRYPRYTGWSFDYEWEVAAGTWTFEVLHAGRTIASRRLFVNTREGR